MKLGSLVIHGVDEDEIFNLQSKRNRDNGFLPWVLLKSEFEKNNIDLHTIDVNFKKKVDFEIHLDVWDSVKKDVPSYLIMLESELVHPKNALTDRLNDYRIIFTWNDNLVDGGKYIKINFPNPISINPVDGFKNRDRFCCLIAGNKNLPIKDVRNLYRERVEAIRWFERFAPEDFDLYGSGWHLPEAHTGFWGKFERFLWRRLAGLVALQPFPSYRGAVRRKHDALLRTRFSICYENVRDLPGYITEKIFDCFFSGCVPVYWGANNIKDYIPETCFIDRRNFRGTSDLYEYLKSITEHDFMEYQQAIGQYLKSEAAYHFGSENFADIVAKAIIQDLGN